VRSPGPAHGSPGLVKPYGPCRGRQLSQHASHPSVQPRTHFPSAAHMVPECCLRRRANPLPICPCMLARALSGQAPGPSGCTLSLCTANYAVIALSGQESPSKLWRLSEGNRNQAQAVSEQHVQACHSVRYQQQALVRSDSASAGTAEALSSHRFTSDSHRARRRHPPRTRPSGLGGRVRPDAAYGQAGPV
jgi:hypothetical protein